MTKTDRIFSKKVKRTSDFNFGRNTTKVFDDMLERSVPFYDETQKMIAEMTKGIVQSKTRVYDLGCSTGTTIINIAKDCRDKNIQIIGIDYSASMLHEVRNKLRKNKISTRVRLEKHDLNKNLSFANASVIIMNLTLQFIRPVFRERLIGNIYRSLKPNGALILIEKVLGESSLLNRIFIDLYYDFKKRQGYSNLEIAQKREALENILIPYRLSENMLMLKRTGFPKIDVFFKWYNFCGIIAIKGEGYNG